MATIGIIDDKSDLRKTLKRRLDLELPGKWNSIDYDPLPQLKDYPEWLSEFKISVLLLDEKLHEQGSVSYNGNEVVSYLRSRLPTLPIFVITTYPDDEELEDKFKDVEEIIERSKFVKEAEKYVPRVIRSAQRYLETFQGELKELSDKSKKIAEGKATKSDINKIGAIQNKLNLAFPHEAFENRNEWMKEFEKKLKELEKLKIQVEKLLKK